MDIEKELELVTEGVLKIKVEDVVEEDVKVEDVKVEDVKEVDVKVEEVVEEDVKEVDVKEKLNYPYTEDSDYHKNETKKYKEHNKNHL